MHVWGTIRHNISLTGFQPVEPLSVKLLNRVENIVAKREIAHFEQCLLNPQCFHSSVCMCERINLNVITLTESSQSSSES